MLFKIRKEEKEIFELISQSASELGVDAYVVGGYVRDRLLGRASNDMDIVCVGSGIELASRVAAKIKPVPRVAYYSRFGTALVKHKSLEIEFVGARKESYNPASRKPAVESGSLQDDLNRRDFTINAMAVSLQNLDFGQIIDPFKGLKDLEHKRLVTPLEPERTFSDDPLRMLRAIRFAAQLEFEIDPVTFHAIQSNRERIAIVSKERISIEIQKIMDTKRPSVGLKLLSDARLLPLIFKELEDLKGVEKLEGKSHKDNFYHTLQVLDNVAEVSDNHWLRWAALLHDIGKAPTKKYVEDVGWTFHGHEVVGAKMVPRIFKSLRLPLDGKMKYVQKLVRLHLRPISLTNDVVSDSAVRRLLFDAGDDIDDLMILCKADITSKNDQKVARILMNYQKVETLLEEVEAKDQLRNWQPPVSGQEIMETFNLKPGPVVGELKGMIRESILEGQIPNEKSAAIMFLIEKAAEMGLKPVDGVDI